MIFVLAVIFLVIFIFQILILASEIKNNNRTFWEVYFSTVAAELISILGVYTYYQIYLDMSLSIFLLLMLLLGIVVLSNIILMILGIIFNLMQKKNLKNENKKIPRTKFKILKIILTFIFICGIIFGSLSIPRIYKSTLEKHVEQYTLNYMNNKYGNCSFKVTNVKKDYTGGFFGTVEKWDGFTIYLKSKFVPESITVFCDGITKDSLKITYDSLIPAYYQLDYWEHQEFKKDLIKQKEDKINKDFASNFNLSINLIDASYDVPEDYGHIPSKEELVDLININLDYADITIKDKIKKDEQENYLKRLAGALIKYFDIQEEKYINYTWEDIIGYIKVENDIVTIKINNLKTEFAKKDILEL